MNITQAAAHLSSLLDLEEYLIESSLGEFKDVDSWIEALAVENPSREKVHVTLADKNRSSLTAVLDDGCVEFTALYFGTETLLAIDCLRTILQNE